VQKLGEFFPEALKKSLSKRQAKKKRKGKKTPAKKQKEGKFDKTNSEKDKPKEE